ncbi:aldo/keto reductase [Rubricoccus marinus]|uniref:L-glyceraldehyde 3-phosphate reductase n=1 Tax=Rubricoccus marinus TaxID=716817 RepID=A0A259TWT1_9BACT|nr:aldo/keto reductase [Rubricoccus marinus]OZC02215.1 L-glyceraldehyde 3-phosphate reductase [Rubricoccus marinus]
MLYRSAPPYAPAADRYSSMEYVRCGQSGLKLPPISLGLWHNFGSVDPYENARAMALRAFDLGITHFDLANNYGPEFGSAEATFGRILAEDLAPYRDELLISTKAGYRMMPGPYGEWGSRKYLLASLDQSLSRMGIDYVDIFYSHRYDPETPLAETMGALAHAVHAGKAIYTGISNYPPQATREAAALLEDMGAPLLIHQPKYSMLERAPEAELFGVLEDEGVGAIVFSPLAQGLLTDKYLDGIPEDSRAAKASGFLREDQVTDDVIGIVRALREIARERNQSMAQLALAWTRRRPEVTSTLIGASRAEQIEEAVAMLSQPPLAEDEIARIDAILA